MTEPTSPPAPPQTPPEAPKSPPWRRWAIRSLSALLILAVCAYGIYYLIHSWYYEWTDDAFIQGHIIQASFRVGGHVLKVNIDDNQFVHQGDVLAELDPKDFQAKLDQARALLDEAIARQKGAEVNVALTGTTAKATEQEAEVGVEQAQAATASAKAQVDVEQRKLDQARAHLDSVNAHAAQTKAEVGAAEAENSLAESNLKRAAGLVDQAAISEKDYDSATAAMRTATARLDSVRKTAIAAEAQVVEAQTGIQLAEGVLKQSQARMKEALAGESQAKAKLFGAQVVPQRVDVSTAAAHSATAQIEQLRAAVQLAELQLAYTKLIAAKDGWVTRKSIEPGNYVQAGQAVLALVEPNVWVIANFKETQLEHMRPGQFVTIRVDAYPQYRFTGRVDSLQAGSGAAFSLLPAENATGNYVKVVQRVPVKIVFDQKPDGDYLLSPGLSVVPEVRVR
jgi:membrane fusion protein, multidrug efflux system